MAAEQQQQLNLGILIDIVDEEWMKETLPKDEVPLPASMAPRPDENEEPHQESHPVEEDAWRDLALENL